MNRKLNKLEFWSISVMLFGMFFGAGNLIFPPSLGFNAGSSTPLALFTFTLTGVVFPILAVIAVSKTYGLENLASRVNKKFAVIYTILIFLAIGPGLAIPRTGTVPFEMAIVQYLPEGMNLTMLRLGFTIVFFGISFFLSVNSTKLVDSSGKILTPLLIILIVLLFLGVIFNNPNTITAPKGDYADKALSTGFIDGYNTLDAIAGLNFGFLIYLMIKGYKVNDDKSILSYTKKSGFIAGSILFIIYAMFAYMGMVTSGTGQEFSNGAQIISYISNYVYGDIGAIFVITIFTLACLTTCIGLTLSVSEYFATLTPKVNTKTWILITTVVSLVLANFGLDKILEYSVPTLLILYPFSLALTLLGLTHDKFNYTKASYIAVAVVTFLLSIVSVLASSFAFEIPVVFNLVNSLPLKAQGLEWIIPTIVVLIVVQLLTKNRNNN